MQWATPSHLHCPLLWAMNEAELTAGSAPSRIGWVQVGLEAGVVEPIQTQPVSVPGWAAFPERRRDFVEPAMALPALIQCFDDALGRFGVVSLSGLQVTARYLEPNARSCDGYLVSALNWFNLARKASAKALIAFDRELLGGYAEAELVASLQRRNTGSFAFGPVVSVPAQHAIETPRHAVSSAPADLGVSVTLPEWTASAAAWALASVIDAAHLCAECLPLRRTREAGAVTARAIGYRHWGRKERLRPIAIPAGKGAATSFRLLAHDQAYRVGSRTPSERAAVSTL